MTRREASLLKENERVDDLGRGGYRVIQDPAAFCFGVDAVLLAWFMKVHPGERVIDLCTGSGVVAFLADARNPGASYVGLELLPEVADRAARSALLNRAEDHIQIETGDVKTASERFGRASFDVVSVNPPYMKAGCGLENPDEGKAVARHELRCTLEDVVKSASALLKPGGRFYMVHRPERLPEILKSMAEARIAPAEILPVYPFPEKPATMILISGIRGGRNGMKTLPPVVIYRDKNQYAEAFLQIYSEGGGKPAGEILRNQSADGGRSSKDVLQTHPGNGSKS